jgi:hypothetical protein
MMPLEKEKVSAEMTALNLMGKTPITKGREGRIAVQCAERRLA